MGYPPGAYAPLGSPVPLAPKPVVRPSGWWYAAAAGLLVLAVVLAGLAVRQGFRDAEAAAIAGTPSALGTEQTLTFPRPVSATVAYIGPTVAYGEADRQRLIDDLDVRIVSVADGSEVPLGTYEGFRPIDLSESGTDAQYVPLATVRFEVAGDYRLTTRAVPGVNLDESSVYVSESIYRKLRDGLRRAAALASGGTLGAVLLTVILARTRGRAKRAWQAAHPTPTWSPPPGAWPPAPGYGQPPGYGPGFGQPPGSGPGYGPPPGYRQAPGPGWGPPR